MHEDIEPEPAAAARLAGPHTEKLRAFARELAERGEELGLIGPLERPRIWTRHVLNSSLIAPLVAPGSLADIGSGAGLPGLVVAIMRPDVQCVLIEPMERRTQWLISQVQDLSLDNVEVIRARAQDLHRQRTFDTVTARAVSALRKLIPMAAPLVRHGGQLLLLKGSRVEEEAAEAAPAIKKFRLTDVHIESLTEPDLEEKTWVFRATVEKGSAQPHS